MQLKAHGGAVDQVWWIIGGYSRPHYSLLPDVLLVGQSARWSGDTPTFLTDDSRQLGPRRLPLARAALGPLSALAVDLQGSLGIVLRLRSLVQFERDRAIK